MEATQRKVTPTDGLKKFLATRRGAWTLAIASAALAGLVLMVFLNRYRDSVNEGVAPAPVLVADRLIPRGTDGDLVISGRFFKPGAVPEQDLKVGAVTDAVAMKGRVATRDILPGQQITSTDFSELGDRIRSKIARTQRAIQVNVAGAEGLIGTVRPGDHVDVLTSNTGGVGPQAAAGTGRPTVSMLMRDILVLAAPPPGATGGSLIFQATDRQAAQLAFATTNGKLYLLLRPPVGAKDSKELTVTQESLLPLEVTATVKQTEDGGTVTLRAQPGEQP
jgi:Flp pilus assembly protein CpaB